LSSNTTDPDNPDTDPPTEYELGTDADGLPVMATLLRREVVAIVKVLGVLTPVSPARSERSAWTV
jgi:hypothetical protein